MSCGGGIKPDPGEKVLERGSGTSAKLFVIGGAGNDSQIVYSVLEDEMAYEAMSGKHNPYDERQASLRIRQAISMCHESV